MIKQQQQQQQQPLKDVEIDASFDLPSTNIHQPPNDSRSSRIYTKFIKGTNNSNTTSVNNFIILQVYNCHHYYKPYH